MLLHAARHESAPNTASTLGCTRATKYLDGQGRDPAGPWWAGAICFASVLPTEDGGPRLCTSMPGCCPQGPGTLPLRIKAQSASELHLARLAAEHSRRAVFTRTGGAPEPRGPAAAERVEPGGLRVKAEGGGPRARLGLIDRGRLIVDYANLGNAQHITPSATTTPGA